MCQVYAWSNMQGCPALAGAGMRGSAATSACAVGASRLGPQRRVGASPAAGAADQRASRQRFGRAWQQRSPDGHLARAGLLRRWAPSNSQPQYSLFCAYLGRWGCWKETKPLFGWMWEIRLSQMVREVLRH